MGLQWERAALIKPLQIIGTQISLQHQSEGEASPPGQRLAECHRELWGAHGGDAAACWKVAKGGPKAVVGCSPMTWQELKKEKKKRWLIGLAGENT